MRAVRPDETDRAEALLQARAATVSAVGHLSACSVAEQAVSESINIHIYEVPLQQLVPKRSSLQSLLIEEDTFLAQINTRAKVVLKHFFRKNNFLPSVKLVHCCWVPLLSCSSSLSIVTKLSWSLNTAGSQCCIPGCCSARCCETS